MTLLAAAMVLAALWVALPIRMPTAAAQPSTAECLTLADAPSTDLAVLERCRPIVPTDVELAADLAAAYEAAHRSADAIATYQQILALDPSYADVRLRLARLLRAQGDEAGARSQIEAALRIQPNRKALIDFREGRQ